MSLDTATTPAELRAALLADPTLGPIAARAIVDVASIPEVAAAIAAAEAARAVEGVARTASDEAAAETARQEAETHDALARSLRRPLVDDVKAADRELAAALNVKSIPIKRKVAGLDAQAVLLEDGSWGALEFVSQQTSEALYPVGLIVAAKNAVTAISRPQINTDSSTKLATITAALTALVGDGVISQAAATGLLALTDLMISPWERVYGIGAVADAAGVSTLMRGA